MSTFANETINSLRLLLLLVVTTNTPIERARTATEDDPVDYRIDGSDGIKHLPDCPTERKQEWLRPKIY
jgi:hypothetical protein